MDILANSLKGPQRLAKNLKATSQNLEASLGDEMFTTVQLEKDLEKACGSILGA